MADKCICCSKKLGLLNGSHLNDMLCDNCYFPVGGYLQTIEENEDISVETDNYNQLVNQIKLFKYSPAGEKFILDYAASVIKK